MKLSGFGKEEAPTMKEKKRDIIFLRWLPLLLINVYVVFPIYWSFITSLKSEADIVSTPISTPAVAVPEQLCERMGSRRIQPVFCKQPSDQHRVGVDHRGPVHYGGICADEI